MRKTITIVAALLAAFFLSSCDQILEGFYPEFADTGKGVNVSLNVAWDLDYFYTTTVANQPGTFNDGFIQVQLAFVPFAVDGTGVYYPDWGQAQTRVIRKSDLDANRTYNTTFTPSGGKYKVVAWLDIDNTGTAGLSQNNPRPGTIVYTDKQEYYLDLSYWNPSKDSINMSAMLNSTSTIDWGKFQAGDTDYSFSLYSSFGSMDKSNPGSVTMYAKPNAMSTADVKTISVNILKGTYENVSYYGSSYYQTVQFYQIGEELSFNLDFNNVYPSLGDSSWTNIDSLIIQVKVDYFDGKTSENTYPLGLYNSASGGTSYNLSINPQFDTLAPYGYAYVNVIDKSTYSTLYSQEEYLDANGSYSFNFNNIFDPTNVDQQIQIYVYDQAWNYKGYWFYDLTGANSGNLVYYVDNSGSFTTSAGEGYYDLAISIDSLLYTDGYAYVYVVDYAYGNTLVQNSAYLDGDGYLYFQFPAIYDPAGSDQKIKVYLYDADGYYIDEYTKDLTGTLSGSLSYTMTDGGVFTQNYF